MIRKMLTGVHHWQFGVAAIALGIWLHQWWLVALGVYLVADDIYQHWRQEQPIEIEWHGGTFGKEKHPDYRSPVHRLYVYLFGGLHRRVIQWWREL